MSVSHVRTQDAVYVACISRKVNVSLSAHWDRGLQLAMPDDTIGNEVNG